MYPMLNLLLKHIFKRCSLHSASYLSDDFIKRFLDENKLEGFFHMLTRVFLLKSLCFCIDQLLGIKGQ